MRLVVPQSSDQNREFATWAAKELDVTFAEPFLAMAVVDARPVIVGAVVLNNYDGHNIDLSGVGVGAFTPSIVRHLARYVFNERGCSCVTMKTKGSNKKTKKLLAKHFRYVGFLPKGYGQDDAVLYCATREIGRASCRERV